MMQSRNVPEDSPGGPVGDVYDWYQRGVKLLKEGSPAAAASLLERAAAAEPESRSIREALARAQFNSRQYAQAADSFRWIVAANPAEDYAYFGLGLALWRTGDMEAAQEPLAIAVAMRPDERNYVSALKSVRATLRARREM
ncbi:tetratricopeptide repeat protein [Nonomuraea longicatena]|uniref:Tetratricopeptide repeat protein n=1 Tax=Nonomuraea longicatena TaxID=83682 RepID=A0ABP3ZI66_9ACTN